MDVELQINDSTQSNARFLRWVPSSCRVPQNLQAADLGKGVVASDGRCALVSFITSRIAVSRDDEYVVFVTDAALAGQVQSFERSFTEQGGSPDTRTTQEGYVTYDLRSNLAALRGQPVDQFTQGLSSGPPRLKLAQDPLDKM